MKFIVSSTALFSHLQAISRVINSRNSLPILDCFLFELRDGTLFMTASDNDTTLSTSIEVNESDSDGRFAVSSKTLLEALKEIPEQPLSFHIEPSNMEITVEYLNGKYSLMGQNADEYPQAQALGSNAVQVTMGAEILMNGVNRSIFATADDELRPVMNGIYFDISTEGITLVASDGHKLVRCKTYAARGAEKAAFILPKKPANLLKNLLPKEQGDVQIGFDDRNAMFTLENYQMICRLIEGRYPNYNSVIPQNNPHRAIIDRALFISALRRVSVFSSQSSSLIKLSLSENQMKISAQDIDFSTSAEETIACQYGGNPMSIGFKSSFLIDILNNISAQNIIIELADPSRAGVIVPEEQEEDEDLKNPLVFFDLETTGTNINTDRIVEICYLKVYPNGNEEAKTLRINPEMHIPEASTAIHGIHDEDVADCPTFKEVAKDIARDIEGADIAGFNSNRFDVPVLVEEFLRAGIDIDLTKRKFVDVQVIYHKLEQRTLSAAYKFYCVLKAQLDHYPDVLQNDINYLSEYSSYSKNVDFAGRIVYDDNGVEVFNFGKYKGIPVSEVLKKDMGYYGWIMNGDFTLNTKNVLTKIRLRETGLVK